MTAKPVIIGNVVLSNGNLAVLAGNSAGTSADPGFTDLQVAILGGSTPFTLNQSSTGNLGFASSGDSPDGSIESAAPLGNATQGGATIAALPGGGIAVLTWGDSNQNYDLQILNNAGAVTTAPFVVASQITTPANQNDEDPGGNPLGAVAAWSGGLVVAYLTDDGSKLTYQRYTLAGVAVGSPVAVLNQSFPISQVWEGGMAVDSSGDVVFSFGSEGLTLPGSYALFNSTNTEVQSGATPQNGQAVQFVPLSGGGFATADYSPDGTYVTADNGYSNFDLHVQTVSVNAPLTTVYTKPNALPPYSPTTYYGEAYPNFVAILPDGTLQFQEVPGFGTDKADSYDFGTSTLSQNTVTMPAYYGQFGISPTFPVFAINPTSGSESTVVGVALNSSNQLVGEGVSSAVSSPPTVAAGATVTFIGGGAAVTLDSGLTVSDAESSNLVSATITINSGFITGDTLNFNNQNGITGSYSNGTLSLSGTTSVANYQTALDSISYSFTSGGDPTNKGSDTSRTIGWVVNDGTNSSSAASSTVDTTHVAPSISAGGTVTFDGGGSPVTLNSSLSVSDQDSGGNLTSAQVIIGGYISGDILILGAGGVSGVYNNGTLSLSGTASIATYQAALQSVEYSFSPTNGDPTGGGSHTSRTLSWSVNDGSSSNGTSNAGGSSLDIVHEAPTISVGGTVTYSPGSSPIVLDSTAGATDADSGGDLTSATIKINSGFISGDTLTVGTPGGLSSSFSNGTLTLTGSASIATYRTALDSVAYSSSASDPTSGGSDKTRGISWSINDGVASSTAGSSTVDVSNPTANFDVHVYYDANDDGMFGAGDSNLVGVTVNLLDGSGNPTGTTTVTDSFGDAVFAGLTVGTYEVSVDTPTGDIVTQAANLNTPNLLSAGGTAFATEGVFQTPAGTYIPPGATAPTTDPAGTYSPPGATSPTPAPPGSYVPGTGATAPTPDPTGTYTGSPGATAPTPAPAGTYVPTTGATAPTPDSPGTYTGSPGESAPTQAPPGSYVGTTGATAPTPDQPGTYTSGSGSTAPTPADPGYYVPSTGATSQMVDPVGTYTSSPGSSAPVPAPAGTYVSTTGATAPTPDVPGSYTSSPGQSTPTAAPPGSYVSTTGATAPTLDQPGTYTSSSGATAPTQAPPGSYVGTSGATASMLDPPGSYSSSPGASAPTPAPAGSFVASAGATAATPDTPGTYSGSPGSSAPTQAPPGSYVGTAGATASTLDAPGTYTSSAGSTAPTAAPPGSYVGTAGATGATPDAPGTFTSSSGASAPTAAPAGSYVGTAGATAATPDPIGTYSGPGASAPTLAPPGSFVGTAGASAPTLDAPGTYTASAGSTAPTAAPPGSYVGTSGATAATLDAPGTFTSSSGSTAPTAAPPGSYVGTAGATAATADPIGSYSGSPGASAPTLAPPGSYVGTAGATAPTADPVGTYSTTAGATAPTVIPAGFYDPTPSGTPIAAPAGTYIPGTGSTSAGAEIPAPAGYYDAGTGNTSAKIDPAGSYTGSPGSTAPVLAPTGTYVPTAGATAPTVAPPGYYDPGTGNTAPILLPVEVWAKGVSGSWQTASNWKPATVPGAQTNAEITASGFYTVTSSQTTSVGAISTSSGASLDITGGSTFTLAAGTGTGTNAGAVLVGVNPIFATLALFAAPASFATAAFSLGDPTLKLTGPFANTASGLLLASDATIDMIGGSITGGNVVIGLAATLEGTGGSPDTISSTLTNLGVTEAGSGTSLTLSGATDNLGILEATGGGTLTISGTLFNLGLLDANGGNVTVSANQISGAAEIYSASKMTFLGTTSVSASFQNSAGATGELVLAKASSFNGSVSSFFYDGTHSDTLDLGGIGFASGVTWSFTESSNGKQGVLTVADHSGDTAKITLLGGYLAAGKSATSATSSIFQLASDGATPTAGTLVTTKVL